jgi:hypothetical protein
VFRLPVGHHFLGGPLRLAHRPALSDGFFGNFSLQRHCGQSQKTAGVSGGKTPFGYKLLQVVGELQQAQEVDDRATVFASALADLLGIQVELFG